MAWAEKKKKKQWLQIITSSVTSKCFCWVEKKTGWSTVLAAKVFLAVRDRRIYWKTFPQGNSLKIIIQFLQVVSGPLVSELSIFYVYYVAPQSRMAFYLWWTPKSWTATAWDFPLTRPRCSTELPIRPTSPLDDKKPDVTPHTHHNEQILSLLSEFIIGQYWQRYRIFVLVAPVCSPVRSMECKQLQNKLVAEHMHVYQWRPKGKQSNNKRSDCDRRNYSEEDLRLQQTDMEEVWALGLHLFSSFWTVSD